MVLYNSPISGNCYKVRLLAAHLGVPLELRELDVLDRSNRPEVLGELNPALRVPTLVLDDGRPLAESNAIIWFLGDGTRFVPSDPYLRAQVLQWMFFEQYEHEPGVAVARFLLTYSGRPDDFAERIEQQQRAGYRALDMMERYLRDRDWLVGDGDHARRHLPLRVHARRRRGRVRSGALPGDPTLARSRHGGAGAHRNRRLSSYRSCLIIQSDAGS